jgi:hypothetical protein
VIPGVSLTSFPLNTVIGMNHKELNLDYCIDLEKSTGA